MLESFAAVGKGYARSCAQSHGPHRRVAWGLTGAFTFLCPSRSLFFAPVHCSLSLPFTVFHPFHSLFLPFPSGWLLPAAGRRLFPAPSAASPSSSLSPSPYLLLSLRFPSVDLDRFSSQLTRVPIRLCRSQARTCNDTRTECAEIDRWVNRREEVKIDGRVNEGRKSRSTDGNSTEGGGERKRARERTANRISNRSPGAQYTRASRQQALPAAAKDVANTSRQQH